MSRCVTLCDVAVLNVRVPEELRVAVERRAAADRRRVSDVVRLALEGYLSVGPEVSAQRGEASVEVASVGARSTPAPRTEVAVPVRAGRSAARRRGYICEHRIPPSAFCKVCDG